MITNRIKLILLLEAFNKICYDYLKKLNTLIPEKYFITLLKTFLYGRQFQIQHNGCIFSSTSSCHGWSAAIQRLWRALFHSVDYTDFPKAKNIGIATETCMELCDSFIEYKSHPVKMQKYQIQSQENTHFGELAATLKKTM